MIDLNTGSGHQYVKPADRTVAHEINALIDQGLTVKNKAQPPRKYVSTSGLGRECLRQIQFDFLGVPKDDGRDFEARTLRIFQAGHYLEDIVAGWLRMAGFDLRTHRQDGSQFGFSALAGKSRGHIDGCLVAGPVDIQYPALWENKALGDKVWRDVVKKGVAVSKPIYAAQMAVYQAYLELGNPALFTAINRDTWELHAELVPFDQPLAQRMSDKVADIVRATDAEELLPRAASDRCAAVCRGGRGWDEFHFACSWQDRCWSLPK